MPVHLKEHKLTYFSVPKVACTSLKRFFFEIENGFPFKPFKANGRVYRIHEFSKSIAIEQVDPKQMQGHVKIAVVRDPWRRILSCYTSKVLKQKDLEKVKLTPQQKKRGLVAQPSIDNFIDLLPEYQAASWSIRHHSRPLSFFLGTDPDYFDKLYSISALPEFVRHVSEIVGDVPKLEHSNKTSGASAELPQEAVDRNRPKVEAMFSEDLEIFGNYM